MNKGKPGFDPEKLPAFHDPFAGGGSIPLEAQRLGLEAYASDLNPVAVLINKAMIEIPPKFAGRPPVGPVPPGMQQQEMHEDWSGARGLAEDVRRYGYWMREEAFKRIGHLYPPVEVTAEMAKDRDDLKPYVGEKLTVIAWLWARTVKSPNPAFSHVHVPLVSSFVLSSKKGKEAWVEPVVEGDGYRFEVRMGPFPEEAKKGTKISRGSFRCILSDSPMKYAYIDDEANAGRMGTKLLAIVAEGKNERIYIDPIAQAELIAKSAVPVWKPETPCRGTFASNAQGRQYGFHVFGDYFTPRQLAALTIFSELVQESREKIIEDALNSDGLDDGIPLPINNLEATAYADAVSVYLSLGISRLSDIGNSLCRWENTKTQVRNLFSRQAISMMWDFAENNVFGGAAGDYTISLSNLLKALGRLSPIVTSGKSFQKDARLPLDNPEKVFSIDPPYYDNVGYADLSDFFYVWLRKCLKAVYPDLFATIAAPKTEELVATPYRHGSKKKAELFFMKGMSQAIENLSNRSHPAYPVTIYYAFKQSETKDEGTASTGWLTFLEAVLNAGFSITGTWPMRTELNHRMVGTGTNALASSIVLVCRKRPQNAPTISRRQFQRELREQLPEALETMIGGSTGRSPIAPVDLAQAAIGPGMAIFSKYAGVLNQDGAPMSVHDALILINREITNFLTPESGSFDADTLFCATWFDQYGWSAGPFGEADTLARAKGTSVDGVRNAGVVDSGGGKVRLLKWEDYPADWDPKRDLRTPVWEACHQIIRTLKTSGETVAGALLAKIPERGESIRQLAYHLYTLCERKKWAEEARAYNELITSWGGIVTASQEQGHARTQMLLGEDY
jgi:putative DNA methylase